MANQHPRGRSRAAMGLVAAVLAISGGLAMAQPPGLLNEHRGLPPTGFAAPSHGGADALGGSPAEAAKRAQALNGGGRVLSVEPQGDAWRVKLLKDGVVRVVNVPR